MTGIGASLNVAGPLKLAEFEPAALLKALAIAAPADAAVLKRASLSAQLDGGSSRMALRDLALGLDDSKLSGRLAIEDFDRMALRFDLALDRIDIDRYLPPGEDKAAKGAGTAGGEQGPALPALDVDGRLAVTELKVSGLRRGRHQACAERAGRALSREARGYPVWWPLSRRYRPRRSARRAGRDCRRAALGVGDRPLLRALTGKGGEAHRPCGCRHQVSTSGPDAAAYKRNLDGRVSLRVADGAVKGVNVAAYLRQAQARLSGKPVAEAGEAQQTDFSDLTATITLDGGVAQ